MYTAFFFFFFRKYYITTEVGSNHDVANATISYAGRFSAAQRAGAPNAHIVQGSTVGLKSPHHKKKKKKKETMYGDGILTTLIMVITCNVYKY